jgi:DNA-binding CsgD family transcriptional regulator
MTRFSHDGLLRVHRFLLEIHGIHDLDTLRRSIPELAARLIASDRANFNEFDLAERERMIIPSPVPAYWTQLSPVLFAHKHEHPLGNPNRSLPLHTAFTFGERRNGSAWRRSVLYNEYYIPAGVQDQLFVHVLQRGTVRFSLAFNRSGRGFSIEERALLELISPHVACAWETALEIAGLRQKLVETGEPALPRYSPTSLSPALTPREREILRWLREGKRNGEIGVILGISGRTVGKHLEHVFEKLGVETRTAAVRAALEIAETRPALPGA